MSVSKQLSVFDISASKSVSKQLKNVREKQMIKQFEFKTRANTQNTTSGLELRTGQSNT